MYKLVVISGPNRGTSYALQPEGLTIGRQSGNSVVLSSAKVSKQHCSLSLSANGAVTLKDLGSSNGTFVNGVLIKTRQLKIGDRLSVGEYVLELMEPPKKISRAVPALVGLGKISQTPQPWTASPSLGQVAGLNMNLNTQTKEEMPKDLKGKIIWFFDHRIMPIFYGLNQKHEWQIISMGVLVAFVLGNLIISVYPLLQSNRELLIKETSRRAKFMAKQIADLNSPFLAARAETKTDVSSFEIAEGVRSALLLDMDSRIIAPGSKLNQYLTSGGEATIAVKARDSFRAGKETGYLQEIDDLVVAVEPVKVLSPAQGRNVIVAMAIVSLDTSLSTLDLGEMGVIYSETLILTGLLGGLLFLILYRLTLKPFQVLNEDMDKALKGEIAQVSHLYQFSELDALWDIINSAIQRIPKNTDHKNSLGFGMSASASFVEEISGPLKMVGSLVNFGFVILDSDKKIIFLNSIFEEVSGIRLEGALGSEISDVARDQSLGAFVNDIVARAPIGGEGVSEDYDFSGVNFKIHAAAFGASGGMGRCFILAAVKST